jgi:hypothetical protein
MIVLLQCLRLYLQYLQRSQHPQPFPRVTLATTPEQARAELLAATGRRVWEPSPDMPALVIDEYAEPADDAHDAMGHADSIARLGRAVAVTLVAANQRPTQKAMGQGTVRSHMNLRICFRVRERRDVDLILGQGILNAGWHAHALNAPGKFLISSPEHDTPRHARAYLVTDQHVAEMAARHAACRPQLDEISQGAIQPSDDPRAEWDEGAPTRTRRIRHRHPAVTRPTQPSCSSSP